ncbi:MAG: bacillithiol biosynthesis deacetylase BshB1 [Flavobacteriaceae bacterium]|jgi:bacillithiol biosynthesis deacetylase BshB1|nr:bacillithiol biosynthesis deacetylase BshB1 [Flavobacteriaceae bacterium]|tara:strand:+ start:4970 stop:5686 length:717 start_codon:yes stop_codon:yes gene_type:complete
MKIDILAIGAHPDDVELGCSGTIAKEIANNKKVGILDLTKGELGTRGSAKIREKEANDAAKILNVAFRENLNLKDGFFKNDEEHQLKLIQVIRKYKPDIILCNAIDDRHIDHPRGAKLVIDSCFLSGLKKIVTEYNNKEQEPWRPLNIYHYIQWKNLKPDFVVDISNYFNVKIKAVKSFKSQFYNEKEPIHNTPISTKNFLDSIEYRARDLGRLTNVDYAEGFISARLPLIDSISVLK